MESTNLNESESHSRKEWHSDKSERLFERQKKLIPSGSSSLMRTSSWEPYPLFINRGKGSRIWDIDGNQYIDFLMAFGPLINGHSHPKINNAVKKQIRDGYLFGAPNELEYKLAKMFMKFVPNQDRVIFSLSGSDATFNAIRLARAATGKDVLLKFEGHYHGLHDYAAISVESPPVVSGLKRFPRPLAYTAGIPAEVMDTVVVANWNDPESLERILKIRGNEIAAIIMEPIMANSSVVLPDDDYLKAVRELADEYNIVFIMDEVITGFRVSEGGAQKLYNVKPDISTWAKALGNGLTISAISGKAEYLDLIGNGVAYGGTYFASPISLAGALENLRILSANDFEAYRHLKRITRKLAKGIEEVGDELNEDMLVNWETGLLSFAFSELRKVKNYRESIQSDWEKYQAVQKIMLKKGIYLHPDAFERIPLSTVHSEEDIEAFINALRESVKEYKETEE